MGFLYSGISHQGLVQLAEQYGTPLYVYDAERIRHQYRGLSQAFRDVPHRIYYASKALTNVNILHLLLQEGSCVDCVSEQEVRLAKYAGFDAQQILYSPSCPSRKEFEQVARMGTALHIDSLSLLEWFGKTYGSILPVGLRINPELPPAGKNYKISTGHAESKFGISITHYEQIVQLVKKYNISVQGIHQHTGSDIENVSILGKAFDTAALFMDVFPDLYYIDIGGGFKVPYKLEEEEIDIVSCAQELSYLYETFCDKYGKRLELWLEPGKYLVSQSGYFLTTVNTVKATSAINIVAVDSGFNHLIRPMFYDAYHHIENLSNGQAPSNQTYDIVGVLCESDTFAKRRSLPRTKEGDVLCFYNAGAYGFEMASWYNSRLRPAQVLVDGMQSKLIRERDTFETLLAGQLKHF